MDLVYPVNWVHPHFIGLAEYLNSEWEYITEFHIPPCYFYVVYCFYSGFSLLYLIIMMLSASGLSYLVRVYMGYLTPLVFTLNTGQS